ncbi:hypothetical protein HWB81_gp33 [Bacillus phage Wes44]|uniref:Uncharacterized protein n=1 Tax=Bacillus phage Wes44 TaxID=2283012 RepID=A0A346FK37_9CAUD|nr:hypothetical protein HWB81_gp33 [Bacillus phage Wes44]AXN58342.1 hypothetical protein Wes44_33 [Bacillus phage Wes44]
MKIQVTIEATTIEEYVEAINALAAGYQVAPNPITAEVFVDVKPAKAATNYAQAKEAVEIDTDAEEGSEPKEQSYHRTAKKYFNELVDIASEEAVIIFNEYNVEGINYLSKNRCAKFTAQIKEAILKHTESPKEEKNTETEKQAENEPSEAPKQQSTDVSFVDVKLKAKQIANLPDGKADVKFILDKLGAKKLSDLSEDQYATFMELAAEAEKTPKSGNSDAESSEEVENEKDSSEDKPVTLEMIRSKAKELSVAGYKEEIKAILKEFKAPSLTKIDKANYDEFYEAMVQINE